MDGCMYIVYIFLFIFFLKFCLKYTMLNHSKIQLKRMYVIL